MEMVCEISAKSISVLVWITHLLPASALKLITYLTGYVNNLPQPNPLALILLHSYTCFV